MLHRIRTYLRSPQKRRTLAYAISLFLVTSLALFIAFPVAWLSPVSEQDKFGHLLGFAILAIPAAALHPRSLVVLLPGFMLFGATVELIQPLVGREGDWIDMASNGCGLAGGAVIGLALHKAVRRLLA